jgi:hypothetical protein
MSIRSVVMAPHSPTCPPPPLEPPPPLPSVSRSLRVHLLRRCWSTGPSFLRHRRVSLRGHRSVPYPGCPPLALPRHFTGHHCQIWPLHCHESSSFVSSTSVGAGSESLAPGQSPSPRAPGHRSSPLLAPAPPLRSPTPCSPPDLDLPPPDPVSMNSSGHGEPLHLFFTPTASLSVHLSKCSARPHLSGCYCPTTNTERGCRPGACYSCFCSSSMALSSHPRPSALRVGLPPQPSPSPSSWCCCLLLLLCPPSSRRAASRWPSRMPALSFLRKTTSRRQRFSCTLPSTLSLILMRWRNLGHCRLKNFRFMSSFLTKCSSCRSL